LPETKKKSMNALTRYRGIQYERLMLRAMRLRKPVRGSSGDRRVYFLLYYINVGADLRGTGYSEQFAQVRNHVAEALNLFSQMELHAHEAAALSALQKKLVHASDEATLGGIIDQALRVTERLTDTENTSF